MTNEADQQSATTPAAITPLLWPFVGLAFGIAIADRFSNWFWFLLIAMSASAAIAFIVARRTDDDRRWAFGSTVALLFLAMLLGAMRVQPERVQATRVDQLLADGPLLVRVDATVVSEPIFRAAEKRNPYYPQDVEAHSSFLARTTAFVTATDTKPFDMTLRVRCVGESLTLQRGDRVTMTGMLLPLRGRRNPGAVDWARISRLQGVDATLFLEGAQYIDLKAVNDGGLLTRLRRGLRAAIVPLLHDAHAATPDDATTSLLNTVVLGQRSQTKSTINEAFQRAGGAHFLAVSGFHVGILLLAVVGFLRIFRASNIVIAIAMILAVVLYGLVAEAHAPILRAGLMASFFAIALLLGRGTAARNWLCLAGFVLLLINPYELFRAGFQLSFVQVGMLLTVFPFVRSRLISPPTDTESLPLIVWQRVWRWFADLALICALAWLTALPLVAHHFGVFSLWGVVGTMLLSPLVALLVCVSFFSLPLLALVPVLRESIRGLLNWLSELILNVANIFNGLAGAQVKIPHAPMWLVLVTYFAAGVVFFLVRQRVAQNGSAGASPSRSKSKNLLTSSRLTEPVVCGGLIVAVLLAWVGWYIAARIAQRNQVTLLALDVGNGSTNVLISDRARAFVIDAGTLSNWDVGTSIADMFRARRIRKMDAAIISHANIDHYSGIPTILANARDAALYVNPFFPQTAAAGDYLDLPDRIAATGIQPTPLAAGDEIKLDAACIEILWPPANVEISEPNDRSLVVRIYAYGRSLLIPGDIEDAAIAGLIALHERDEIDLQSDVLIAPHHGAVLPQITRNFYTLVQPEVVIASTRRPQPRLKPLCEQLFGAQTKVYLTSEVGAVAATITQSGTIQIATYADR